MTGEKQKRARLLAIVDTLDGAGKVERDGMRAMIRNAPASELARIARVVAAMVRAQKTGNRARRAGEKVKAKNPQLLTIGNPSPGDIRKAIAAYRRFHGVDPDPKAFRNGDGKGILIALGELRRVDYEPRKGERRRTVWFHHFKPGAVLCTDPDGRRLVVLDRHGKQLVDFDRGIIR